jgi:hypothetical protein
MTREAPAHFQLAVEKFRAAKADQGSREQIRRCANEKIANAGADRT